MLSVPTEGSHLEHYREFVGIPDSKVHGANMGPMWGQQDPGGPHVGQMDFGIWDGLQYLRTVEYDHCYTQLHRQWT